MRIVVCVKQAYDPETVRISRSREELDLRDAVSITNIPDRYAIETALQLRSALGGEVIAVTVGDAGAENVAREAVAMGADRAVLILAPESTAAGGGAVAHALAAALVRLQPVDLVLTGQIGLLDGSGCLASRLAVALGWPVALDVVRLAPANTGSGWVATVTDGERGSMSQLKGNWAVPCNRGLVLELSGPTVVAIVPGPVKPRYPHPARIANAWQPGLVELCSAADLGLGAPASEVEMGRLILGPERVRGQVLKGEALQAAESVLELLRARRIV